MDFSQKHIVKVCGETFYPEKPEDAPQEWRQKIEPWLSAVFQAEHLSLLLGNGFTSAITHLSGKPSVSMDAIEFVAENSDKVKAHAEKMAKSMGRGSANIEDELTAAIALLKGLEIIESKDAADWKINIDGALLGLTKSILQAERDVNEAISSSGNEAKITEILISFLMSFASRTASRDRLNIFTTNYDRIIERGCDLAGLRLLDRFVGSISPEFRSSRLKVDMHYTPPGVRGEPRHLEGVVYLTKLHGSLDWRYDNKTISKVPLSFGAAESHPDIPASPSNSLMIYPNSAKDIETASYPYADLFRDYSSALCQPNSVLVTYGYGFGDSHVNRVISDMLTLPSTHLVIIAWGEAPHDRVKTFVEETGHAGQISLLLGTHFGDIQNLVGHYLPKPAIDPLTQKMGELIEKRSLGKKGEPAANDDGHKTAAKDIK